MKAIAASITKIYQLKIKIDGVHPPLWRRLEICGDWDLLSAADAIKSVFGWSDHHMCEFIIKKRRCGDGNDWVRIDTEQEYQERSSQIYKQKLGIAQMRKLLKDLRHEIEKLEEELSRSSSNDSIPTLQELVPRVRTKFRFIFDLGDCWKHTVEVEKIKPPEPGALYPRCTAGAGANPIEDIGGAWRLSQIIEVIKNPSHPGRKGLQELLEFAGDYDPEDFSVEKTNQKIAAYFPKRKPLIPSN
jgi:hypothetical protein